jgi:hypothetical protein
MGRKHILINCGETRRGILTMDGHELDAAATRKL